MQVVAAGQSRLTRAADLLLVFHLITLFDRDGAHVAVKTLNAAAVIDDHRVAVDSEIPRKHDDAVIGGAHGHVFRACQVKPEVRLMVHSLPAINVSAVVGEAGFRLAGQAEERPFPQEPRCCALGKCHQLLCVLLPKGAVDQQEILDQASLVAQFGGLAHDRGDDVLQEFSARRLVQVDGVRMEFLGKNLVV